MNNEIEYTIEAALAALLLAIAYKLYKSDCHTRFLANKSGTSFEFES